MAGLVPLLKALCLWSFLDYSNVIQIRLFYGYKCKGRQWGRGAFPDQCVPLAIWKRGTQKGTPERNKSLVASSKH